MNIIPSTAAMGSFNDVQLNSNVGGGANHYEDVVGRAPDELQSLIDEMSRLFIMQKINNNIFRGKRF